MTRLDLFAPQASRDLEEAAAWLAERAGPEIARRLAHAAVETAVRVRERPLLGRRQPMLLPDPFRFWSLTNYPYLLIYNAERSPPQILRVLHTARDLPPLLADLRD